MAAGAGLSRLKRLRALARYLAVFADSTWAAGRWVRPKTDPGTFASSWFKLNEDATRFVEDCYACGWVLGGFDWAAWAGTREAQRLRDEPEALTQATELQLARLLTVVIRQERFVDGALGSAFETGLILGIVRRAKQLFDEAKATP